MKTKIMNGNGRIKVGIVGSLHGNERLGAHVIDRISRMRIPKEVSVVGVVANIDAMRQNRRFLDTDGNRCFPGSRDGNREEKMAYEVLAVLRGCNYVIDIHSTYAQQADTIISTKESQAELIKHIPVKKVLVMSNAIASGGSLIDHVKCGVSIEFSRKRPTDYVTQKVMHALESVAGGKSYGVKETYRIIGFFGEKKKDYRFKNFKEITDMRVKEKFKISDKVFPVFVGEKGYGANCMIAVPFRWHYE